MSMWLRGVVAIAALACLMGHDHGCGDAPGSATAARCDASLTWSNFGNDFMNRFCTGCHASTVGGAARQGAPVDHDFDTPEGVRAMAEHVELSAAAGPAAMNVAMPPPGHDAPTRPERELLGRWLACGAP
jgi:uncharacterized membrane protein